MPALSAVLLTFSFQSSLLFFNTSLTRPHQHCSELLVLIRNIGYRRLPKIWVSTFPVRSVYSRRKTEVILTVKMETRYPVEGSFGSKFPAICNHCGVITASNRKTWKFVKQILRIFPKNDPLW